MTALVLCMDRVLRFGQMCIEFERSRTVNPALRKLDGIYFDPILTEPKQYQYTAVFQYLVGLATPHPILSILLRDPTSLDPILTVTTLEDVPQKSQKMPQNRFKKSLKLKLLSTSIFHRF